MKNDIENKIPQKINQCPPTLPDQNYYVPLQKQKKKRKEIKRKESSEKQFLKKLKMKKMIMIKKHV